MNRRHTRVLRRIRRDAGLGDAFARVRRPAQPAHHPGRAGIRRSGTDLLQPREVAHRLGVAPKSQSVIVDNKPGPAEWSAQAVVRAAPDGHTLLYLWQPTACGAGAGEDASDVQRDLQPIAQA
jgi:tripartite-type tricarboxylate transporter receptor subunit TctC